MKTYFKISPATLLGFALLLSTPVLAQEDMSTEGDKGGSVCDVACGRGRSCHTQGGYIYCP